MRHWTLHDYHTMPWKNGGGSTTELAVFPEQAGLDQFIWRLSTASVSSAGPFSHFARIDRTLAVLSGQGLIMHCDSESQHAASVTLTRASQPYRFAGETPVFAELLEGETVLDLNMMTRRDACTHHMQRLGAGQHAIEAQDAQQVLLFCAQGEARLDNGSLLQASDLCLFEENTEHAGIRFTIEAAEQAELYLIRIHFLVTGLS
ncbi:HutD/Ves family protein [Undibacterium crateris]|uniref:HutD/Ves family protein n=1 Tax=Undibacterium crateris TaxID=2528175 RepID=UPI00138A13DD|nr:HutD family protein [Undibacterium crateris]NDI86890.1 HutD family protein [Undibacterium crateris]